MKKYDVVALGELLIDFTENGISSQGNPLMEANPGGAPCNVLAMLKKYGHEVLFLGKVGKDIFGRQLRDTLIELGISSKGLLEDPQIPTTLAFVKTLEDGDREFSFYRNPGADMRLTIEDIEDKKQLIEQAKIFHFGTLSMTHEGCRMATRLALEYAKASGALISFDPNLREPLWDDLDTAKEQILYGLSQCDILKISDNEITWLTDKEDYDEGVAWIQERFDIPLITVSMGKEGSRAYTKNQTVSVRPFRQEATIETTGAGDTFCAGILHFILEHGLSEEYSKEELEHMLTYANAGASIITTRKGALRVMPEVSEIEAFVKEREESDYGK